ncbi:alpha/beta-hydrolase [Clavulina sp. PMI_390]|nr:alpha/beta-hydrolase [Clavulina sp. PMI_390]
MTVTNSLFLPSITGTVKRAYVPRKSWRAVIFWWAWRFQKVFFQLRRNLYRRIRRLIGQPVPPPWPEVIFPKGPQIWGLPPPALVNRMLESDRKRAITQWEHEESGWVMPIVSPLTDSKESSAVRRTIFYLYGSGFTDPPIMKWHWAFIGYLSRWLDAELVVVPYPVGPNNPGPEWRPTLLRIYKEFLANAGDKEIILAGDSAGSIVCNGLVHELHAAKIPLPHQLVIISPAFDLQLPRSADMKAIEPCDNMLTVERCHHMLRVYAGIPVPQSTVLAQQVHTIPLPTEFTSNPCFSAGAGDPSIFREAGTKVIIANGEWDVLFPEADSYIERLAAAEVDATYIVGEKQFHIFPVAVGATPECTVAADIVVEAILKNGEEFHRKRSTMQPKSL